MAPEVSFDSYSSVLQKIYAAAADPRLWRDAFYAIEDLTGSAGATLNFVPITPDQQGLVLSGRFTEDICAEFARDYMAICPRTDYGIRYSRGLIDDSEGLGYDSKIFSEAEMDRDPVYNWFGRLGLRYYIGASLPSLNGYLLNFSLQRTRRQGHVQPDDIALFRQLKVHIEQALLMSAKLGALTDRYNLTAAALDRLHQGVIIAGERGEVLLANDAADRLLSQALGLKARQNILEVTPPNDQKRFAGLVRGAAHIAGGEMSGANRCHERGGWLRLDRGENLSPLSLFIAPLAGHSSLSLVTPLPVKRRAAIIFIHDGEAELGMSVGMLRGLFGLTPVEAQLADLLGRGTPLDQAAAKMGHSTGTARNHLKSIFSKMDINRQQDLVYIVTGMLSQGLAGERRM